MFPSISYKHTFVLLVLYTVHSYYSNYRISLLNVYMHVGKHIRQVLMFTCPYGPAQAHPPLACIPKRSFNRTQTKL